jgi:hypothetical protein|tara:strand:- start:464 stop:889 length:426 start_codon:yes stop_codon:yes gene_type:complete
MAITSAICNSFKQQLLVEGHNLTNGADSIKLALYTSSATLGAGTTVYVTTGQSSGTNITAGGQALTNVTPALSGSVAVCDFADEVFATATVTARGCLIYNSTNGNKAIAAIDFGADKVSTAGDFTVVFPSASSSAAIIRLA